MYQITLSRLYIKHTVNSAEVEHMTLYKVMPQILLEGAWTLFHMSIYILWVLDTAGTIQGNTAVYMTWHTHMPLYM